MGVKIWDDWILTHIRKSEIEGGEWGKLYERWGRGAQTKKLASRACNHGVTSTQKYQLRLCRVSANQVAIILLFRRTRHPPQVPRSGLPRFFIKSL